MAQVTAPLSVGSILIAATLAGCTCDGGGRDTSAAAGSGAPSASARRDDPGELQRVLSDPRSEITPKLLERLLLDLQGCKLGPNGVDPKCEAFQRFQQGQKRTVRRSDQGKLRAKVGKKHLTDENPSVRVQAAQLLLPRLAWHKPTQKLLVKAATAERDVAVLVGMIRTVGPHIKRSPELKQLLFRLADHPQEKVRQEATRWFLTSFSADVEGAFDKALEKLESDPSVQVRASLCKRLFASGDERALEVFEEQLTSPDTPDELRQACFYGLVHAWTGFRRPPNPSKKAYELTLRILEAQPRSEQSPPWTGLSALRSAKTDLAPGDRLGQKWLEQVRGWYQPARLRQALLSVASDGAANVLARTAAVDAMNELRTPKADFERLEKKLAGAKQGDDWHVRRRVEMILRQKR